MADLEFESTFCRLTDHSPFPWQTALYRLFLNYGQSSGVNPFDPETDAICHELFSQGQIPKSCNLPTGLGKTSVIALWLIALAHGAHLPRRLVYVVNRRTVVDQTTDEAEKYQKNLEKAGLIEPLARLSATPSTPHNPPLAISTLRGEHADNRAWSADPSRPAVICGTVDMIGSRLLFSGYGIGMKARPLHAGFLGQDAWLVHDEAHLEPAFQELITAIEREQGREPPVPWPKFRVLELTATSRASGEVFSLSRQDAANSVIQQRMHAKKAIQLHTHNDPSKLAESLAEWALQFQDSGRAILIYARKVEDVLKVRDKLTHAKLPTETLTGTMRGKEREALIESQTFARFLPDPREDATPGTVYLVCTSAGEVGVNISADHLVCDLTTFESMAQRFGRVNRFGVFDACEIHVVCPSVWRQDDIYDQQRKKTRALLEQLNGDGSPAALAGLPAEQRTAAFAPEPIILPTTDILFDAWSLTSIPGKLPGRPRVEPYLHGLPTDWQPPETQVAWREEVALFDSPPWIDQSSKERDRFATDLLERYPLKPPELLRDHTARVFDRIKKMKLPAKTPVWLQDEDGSVSVTTFASLLEGDKTDLNFLTVILPLTAGGLNAQGMLDDKATAFVPDASEAVFADREKTRPRRMRLWSTDVDWEEKAANYRLIHRIAFTNPDEDDDTEGKEWLWFALDNEGDQTAKLPVTWTVHVGDVERCGESFVAKLSLSEILKNAVRLAARFHDHGKKRLRFQRVLGNTNPHLWLAKSGKKGGRIEETYRHEFGSLVDLEIGNLLDPYPDLDHDTKELIAHLIAAHHGRARPHFPADEAFDPDGHHAESERIARETPRRFARLQRRFGRWGLAYLESLLRAADWAASAEPSEYLTREDRE